jgi:5-methylcytosine-specific restriction endonuclease McrA
MKKISWVNAKNQGLPRYFTGRPCKQGHIAERRVSGRHCIVCADNASRLWAKENPGRVKEIVKKWNVLNRKEEAARAREWRKNNPETYKKAVLNWRNKNATYYGAYMASAAGRRRTAKLKATPSWLSKEQNEAILCKYQVAAMYTAEGLDIWHVDHIVPIRGKDVCGLHVPWNLRIITASENLRKGNKFSMGTRA